MFSICIAKKFPFLKIFLYVSHSDFPIINDFEAILKIVLMKKLLWYILFGFSKRLVFTVIIIKPKVELYFSVSNI